jgi:hypothetical protein
MEKNGMLTNNSFSDFDKTKKAEWYDEEDFHVADEAHKKKLKKPKRIKRAEFEEEDTD